MSGRDLDPQHLLTATPPDATPPSSTSPGRGEGPDVATRPIPLPSVILGELLALADDGSTPLVMHPAHPGALRARSTIDLHGAHIGRQVVLVFEHGDPLRPIVTGVLRDAAVAVPESAPGQVEIDADGRCMQVSAREQLVLRCGKASITLTKAGKVLIDGSYVLSRSTGVNRLKGGSVQVN